MRKEPTEELIKAAEMAKILGGPFHVTTPIVCDHCQDDEKEAFPYHVYDASGKFWHDLCNDCFEKLGCRYDWMDDNGLEDTPPIITTCPDCGAENIPNDGACWYCENRPE